MRAYIPTLHHCLRCNRSALQMKDETNLLHSSFGTIESIFCDVCQLFLSYPETEFIVESSEISSSPKVSLSVENPAQSVDSLSVEEINANEC